MVVSLARIQKNLLIVNSHGMGDVIMTLPAINKAIDFGFEVSLLVKSDLEKSVISLFFPSLAKDNVVVMNRRGGKVLGYLRVVKKIRKLKPDYVIPAHSLNPEKFSLLSILVGAEIRVGLGGRYKFLNTFNYIDNTYRHKVEYNEGLLNFLLKKLGVKSDKPVEMPIYLENADHLKSALEKLEINEEFLESSIGFAPGSGELEAHKRWPAYRYARLGDLISDLSVPVLLLGGEGENEIGVEITSNFSSKVKFKSSIGKLTIEEVFAVVNKLQVVVANCNGLSHVADAVGTKVVGIYGPTDFFKTGPRSKGSANVSLNKGCSPCYRKDFIQGCGNPVCIIDIDERRVFSAVKSVLESR